MSFDYGYVLPPTGPAQNDTVREMFDDIKLYVNSVVPSGGAAPFDAQYVTLATNATLTVERVLAGTTNQVVITDNGAGNTVVLSLPQSIANTSTVSFAGVKYRNGSGNTVTVNPPSSFSNYTLTLPTDDGTANQFLQTDGSGGLTWADVTTSLAANRALSNLSSVAINASLIPGSSLDLGSAGAPWHDIFINRDIVLFEEGTSNDIIIKSPTSLASYTLTLPDSAGTSDYVLRTNGLGTTSWVPQTSIAGLADYNLSNLNVPAVNVSIKPGTDNSIDLGSASKSWRKVFTTGGVSLIASTSLDQIILKAPASSVAYDFTFPQTDGSTNDLLINTDGAGTTSWVSQSGLNLANKALSNLASVAINTALLPGAANTIDLGSDPYYFRDAYIARNLVISKAGGATVTIAASTSGSFTTPYTLTLPIDDGSANQVLTTDGSGVLSWTAGTGAGAATQQLDNLSSVAINTSLLPASNNAIDLGSSTKEFRSAYLKTSLIFQESGAGTDTITIQAPSSIAAGYTLTLPVDDGTSNQVLKTDGSGVLSWVDQSGSGTVNSGTAGRIAYYASSTTAVSELSLLTTAGTTISISNAASGAAVLFQILNTSNTASSTANLKIQTAGSTADDPYVTLDISGVTTWTLGADNSDSDKFKISQNSTLGTNDFLIINPTTTAVSIKGTNTNGAAPAGYIGEVLSTTTSLTNAPSSTQYGDAASLSVTAGNWIFFGAIHLDDNTTPSTSLFQIGISTTTGNSSTGLTNGTTLFSEYGVTHTGAAYTEISGYNAAISTTTTYYLKIRVDYPSGVPKFACRFSALRIS